MSRRCLMLGLLPCLLLCVISEVVSQKAPSCPPMMEPINETACEKQTSAFVTCTCSTFRVAVNKFLDEESCLIQNVTKEIGKVIENVKFDMKNKAMSKEGIQALLKSNILEVVEEIFDIIRRPAEKIMDTVFSEICSKKTEYVNCLAKNVNKLASNEADQVIMKIINIEHLKLAMEDVCSLREDFKAILSCNWTQLVVQEAACVAVLMDSFNNTNFNIPSVCALIGDMASCTGIQMYSCNKKIGKWLTSTLPDRLENTCKGHAKKGTKAVGASKMIQCGIPPVVSIIAQKMYQKPTSPPVIQDRPMRSAPEALSMQVPSDFSEMFGNINVKECVKEVCREAPMFLECVNSMVPDSQHSIDMFAKEIIDIGHFGSDQERKQIVDAVCSAKTIDAAEKSIPCIRNNVNSSMCAVDPAFNSLSLDGIIDGSSLRKKICQPLSKLANCAVDKYIKPCDAHLYTLSEDLLGWLLRSDCGGKRPSGQFKPVKKHSGASTLNNSVTVFTVLVIGILAYISL